MSFEVKKRFFTMALISAMMIMISSPVILVAGVEIPSKLNIGPYVDRVIYQMIDNPVLSLQSGYIDLISGQIGSSQVPILAEDPDISITSTVRNGYGHLTINCGKYPLNISALRRAFAFAFDKTRVTSEVLHGDAREHDSVVPWPNSWCIEDQLPYHYYTAQVDVGNKLLNDTGFTFDSITGHRLAPDGSEFNIVLEYPSNSVGIGVIQVALDALRALHINADSRAADFYDVQNRLDSHSDYDIVMYATNFITNDVDWLAYEYWSELADTPYRNPTRFSNATFDSWRDQLLHTTNYTEVYDAAKAMQSILHENVPRLIVYENLYMQAYRNDVFTGHVQDLGRYIASQWTMRKIHKIDGTRGGTVRIAIAEPETFNIFLYETLYSSEILINIWPSLYSQAPDLNPWPYIAENMLLETHADNPIIQEGHTRFTIDIIQNATWSDGTPLTADDVAFTFTYLLESMSYGNPKSFELVDIMAAYSPTPYRVIIEFKTESLWHFSNFAYVKIIPKHIFNDEDGIGYSAWNIWNPVFDPTQPYVTSGPFELTDWVNG
ncbi:MAG: ABC transporter substrate-binding protein, partial [Candidatus Thorarchaeota archaeon]